MVYVLSLVIYLLILGAGLYIIKKKPRRVERYIVKLAFLGFLTQLFINWSALGNIPAMPQITAFNTGNHQSLDLMLLAIISIFFYASLLVIFYKSYDYYHDN